MAKPEQVHLLIYTGISIDLWHPTKRTYRYVNEDLGKTIIFPNVLVISIRIFYYKQGYFRKLKTFSLHIFVIILIYNLLYLTVKPVISYRKIRLILRLTQKPILSPTIAEIQRFLLASNYALILKLTQ